MLLASKKEETKPAKKSYPKKEWTLFIQQDGNVWVGTVKKGGQTIDIRVPEEKFVSKAGRELSQIMAKNAEGDFVRVGWLKEVTSEKATAKGLVVNGAIDLAKVGMPLEKKITGFLLPKKDGKPLAISFVESIEKARTA
jgi:hypothetical protein